MALLLQIHSAPDWGSALYPGGGRAHLRDEEQSQGGGDCAVGVEEEEKEGPVRVQGGNQPKPESVMGRRFLLWVEVAPYPSPLSLSQSYGWREEGPLPSRPPRDGGPASRSPPVLQLAFSGCHSAGLCPTSLLGIHHLVGGFCLHHRARSYGVAHGRHATGRWEVGESGRTEQVRVGGHILFLGVG